MQNYQIVLIFDEYHDQKAIRLIERLRKSEIQVLRCTQYTSEAVFEESVKKAEFIFVLLVDDAPLPRELVQNADTLIQTIRNRDKELYVIKEYNAPLPPDFQGYPLLEPMDGTMFSPQGGGIAGMICNLVIGAENKHILYEKLSAMTAIDYMPGIQETLATLGELLCKELLDRSPWDEVPRNEMTEILSIFREWYSNPNPGTNRQEEEMFALQMVSAGHQAKKLNECFIDSEDLLCIATALRIEELCHLIFADYVDIHTGSDVDLYNKPLREYYHQLCQRFLLLLDSLTTEALETKYTSDQISFILTQAERCRKVENPGNEALCSVICLKQEERIKKEESVQAATLTDTEKKLYDIAEYMSMGYTLFESMSYDEVAANFLRCLKTSFERLKNYCNIIEAKAISAKCIGHITEIDQRLSRMDDSEDTPGKMELGLKALLGLKLPDSGQYDVFISYKHEDEDIARSVYHNIKRKMLNVFFDKVTLPELSESDYDEAIMNALDHSRHFLVIITDLKQLQAYWIKLEMKTFHHEMVEGRKKDANFIMLVTDTVFDQITSSNKTVLPLRYRSCEILKIKEYKDAIYGYLAK